MDEVNIRGLRIAFERKGEGQPSCSYMGALATAECGAGS